MRQDEPVYVISIAARLVGVHQQTLRMYERLGLLQPARSGANIRLYSQRDVDRARQIQRLTNEMGVNLAGVEVIFDLLEKMEQLRREMGQRVEQMQAEFERELQRSRGKAARTEGRR